MKIIVFGLVLLGSIALAEPMPTDSQQAELTNALIEGVSGVQSRSCSLEEDLPDIQVACAEFVISPLSFLVRWDNRLFFAENDPEGEPDLSRFDLIPQSDGWTYYSDQNRYERTYDFEGGVYRVLYTPNEERGGSITLTFTP